uniref:Uncharacterized protein n=1 Tax=Aegilops tauschii subsp. strangulata TaxID=200361 RepID=A0A453HLW5_AEGTS
MYPSCLTTYSYRLSAIRTFHELVYYVSCTALCIDCMLLSFVGIITFLSYHVSGYV